MAGQEYTVGKQRLQVIEIKLDWGLSFQVGITFGYIAFVHPVDYLDAVHGELGTEYLYPQKRLYG